MEIRVSPEKTKVFKKTLFNLSKTMDEATLTVNKENIVIETVDPIQSVLAYIKFRPECFDKLDVEETKEIGVNVGNFKKSTQQFGKNEQIVLEEKDEGTLIVRNGSGSKKYYLSILEMEDRNIPDIKTLELPNKYRMNSERFKKNLDDAMVFGENVVYKLTGNSLKVVCESRQNSTDIDLAGAVVETVEEEETGDSMFNNSFVRQTLSITRMVDEFDFLIGVDKPFKMIVDEGSVYFVYVVAPKVKE